MILKTQNLKNDQRVLKEINSLTTNGANVEILVARDCDLTEQELGYKLHENKIWGGAAPKNIIIRIIGVIQFYILSILFIKKNMKSYQGFWVCDPIMFGLVYLLKLIKKDKIIIWDHHELPPTWFMKSKFLMSLFQKSYEKTDIIIHCNASRKFYLEEKLGYKHPKYYILNNYPKIENNYLNSNLEKSSTEWINQNPNFVYLQNCLQDDRNGAVIIKALLKKGFNIFHAGKINLDYLYKNEIQPDNKKLHLAGYLSFSQINTVLTQCKFTVICYKKDSLNQIYCDANRLYQAMSIGVGIIIGDNPTMVEATENYENKIIINGDGSNEDSLIKAINQISNKSISKLPLILDWELQDENFKEILAIMK